LSEYVNLYDQEDAQKILMSAASQNSRVIKPIKGVAYHKMESETMDQARVCGNYLRRYSDPNRIVVEMNGLLESLIFKPETSNIFEESLKKIANYIGFSSQRPEADSGRGPDVLWEVGSLKYFVIECKNGAITPTICKHDCNQLNGSGEWFTNEYDYTCEFTPILIHPSNIFEHAASPKAITRIIDTDKLSLLSENISGFINSICVENKTSDDKAILERLIFYKLRTDDFHKNYTTGFSVKK
jgi:hypothetical protein